MIRNYFTAEAKYIKRYGENTIFLMQCGSFFEVYSVKGRDGEFKSHQITTFSKVCDMTIARKKSTYNGRQIFMAGFSPVERLDRYVNKLNDAGYTVAVHIQDPTVPSIRTELGVFSPGTNFDIKSREITNNLVCIWLEKQGESLLNKAPRIICGMCSIDIFTGTADTFESTESYLRTPSTFDEVERFYSTYSPKEVVVIHNLPPAELEDAVQFIGIDCPMVHKVSLDDPDTGHQKEALNCEKQTYQKEILERFYDVNDYDSFYESLQFKGYPVATQAFCFLLDFIYGHNPNLVKSIKEPTFGNVTDRLVLANHSLQQLNIIGTGRRGRLSSVVEAMNRCKTPMGKRKTRQMILNPTANVDFLAREYAAVSHIKDGFETYKFVRDEFAQVADFERLYRKIILAKLTPGDMAQIHSNIKTILRVVKRLKKDAVVQEYVAIPTIAKACKRIKAYLDKKLNVKVASHIASVSFETNIFKRGQYPELDSLEKAYVESEDALAAAQRCLGHLVGGDQKGQIRGHHTVKVHRTDKSGVSLILTVRRANKLKATLIMLAHGGPLGEPPAQPVPVTLEYASSYDGSPLSLGQLDAERVRFSPASGSNRRIDSPIITQIYTNILRTKANLKEKLASVYAQFVASLREYAPEIDVLIRYVTCLDVLTTRAHLAIKYRYCRPVIDRAATKPFVAAEGLRHPLIEQLQQDELYVPNDIALGGDGSADGALLYGTNAVGKSSLIRALGVSVILAQAGFFVPCTSFSFKPYRAIFTRILGNDNIFKGLSTFAVEMSELRTILKRADESSLILGDELCSGTETTSAISIFCAGVIQLHARRSTFLFATHFHELTRMPCIRKLEGLRMLHMTVRYDRASDALVYDRKLQDGPGDSMYGLEVCKALALPDDFLQLAHDIRRRRVPTKRCVLGAPTSRYNAKKVKGNCEECGALGVDTHHLQPQEEADVNGLIGHFHKNHVANLIVLCKACHARKTATKLKEKRVKTSRGKRIAKVDGGK